MLSIYCSHDLDRARINERDLPTNSITTLRVSVESTTSSAPGFQGVDAAAERVQAHGVELGRDTSFLRSCAACSRWKVLSPATAARAGIIREAGGRALGGAAASDSSKRAETREMPGGRLVMDAPGTLSLEAGGPVSVGEKSQCFSQPEAQRRVLARPPSSTW